MKFFGKSKGESRGETPGEREAHDPRVATCALLLEMANIDNEFNEMEQKDILSILENDFGLQDKQASQLMEEARKELDGKVDLWQFTNRINKNYSREEKKEIIEMVWKVVYADGILDKHEDYLVHKLANLLRLRHKDLIEAKLKVLGKGG